MRLLTNFYVSPSPNGLKFTANSVRYPTPSPSRTSMIKQVTPQSSGIEITTPSLLTNSPSMPGEEHRTFTEGAGSHSLSLFQPRMEGSGTEDFDIAHDAGRLAYQVP